MKITSMKKIIIVCSCLLVVLLCCIALAEENDDPFEPDGCDIFIVEENVLKLPANLTKIDAEAFYGNKTIEFANLPEGIKVIGSRAFAYSGIISLKLPASLTMIADNAFEGCKIALVEAPEGSYAYEWAVRNGFISSNTPEESPLEDFIIENGVVTKYVGPGGDVVIPSKDKDGNVITTISIPNCQESEGAFSHCINLVSITIPKGITHIGSFAFNGCYNLRTVTIPDSVTAIDNSAFYDCGMNYITLPNSITSMGEWVFSKSRLYSVTLPDNLSAISNCAFRDCPFLEEIIIPQGVNSIGFRAFSNCQSIKNIVIPESVSSIGNRAFSGCVNLNSVNIPNNIINIGEYAFENTYIKSVTIPGSVSYIDSGTFSGCHALTKVIIENGVQSIGYRSFKDCWGLTSVDIPISITAIGQEAFYKCWNLDNITIPDQVNRIGFRAFFACSSLSSINIPSSVTDISSEAFAGCANLRKVVISDGVICIGNGMFESCNSLKDITIPSSVTTIGNMAFYECTSLSSVSIPNSVTSIGQRAFYGCTSLVDLVLPSCIEMIGNGAFMESGLTSIRIPSSIKSIENGTFVRCTNLYSVIIPSSVTIIGVSTFYSCTSLKSIYIPCSVKSIGDNTFFDCNDLTAYVDSGSYAEQYCIDNNIRYEVLNMLTVRVRQNWLEYEDPTSMCVIGIASGGVRPYQYRFSLIKGGTTVEQTDWVDQKWFYFHPETQNDGWSVRAEVIDAMGAYAASDVLGATEYIGETDEYKLRAAFNDLVRDAPTTSSLTGYLFNSDMREVAWLNTVIDLLHIDLSILQTQEARQEYLFKQAFIASAMNSQISKWDTQSLPPEIKAITKATGVVDDNYVSAVLALIAEDNEPLSKTFSDSMKAYLTSYFKGDIDALRLKETLLKQGVPKDQISSVMKNCEDINALHAINAFTKGLTTIVEFHNGCVDIQNQLELVKAMDRDAARAIAQTYLKRTDDPAYGLAGARLMMIANATDYNAQIRLIVGGKLTDVGINKLLGLFSPTKSNPYIGFAFMSVDYITGAGSYAETMNELQWACDALYDAENEFSYAKTHFIQNNSQETFMDLVNYYTNYLELAASVEEAFVGVVKWQQKTPICDTPDYVITAMGYSAEKASALRRLSDSVRMVKDKYIASDYGDAATWLISCADEQEAVKSIGRSTGQGSW